MCLVKHAPWRLCSLDMWIDTTHVILKVVQRISKVSLVVARPREASSAVIGSKRRTGYLVLAFFWSVAVAAPTSVWASGGSHIMI